jgi:aquaporin Z
MLPVNYLVEFLGTFVFVYIILESFGYQTVQPFVIAVGLLAAIIMFGAVSGGHFNPAVTTVMWAKGAPDVEPIGYILAQMAGALVAYKIHSMISNSVIKSR